MMQHGHHLITNFQILGLRENLRCAVCVRPPRSSLPDYKGSSIRNVTCSGTPITVPRRGHGRGFDPIPSLSAFGTGLGHKLGVGSGKDLHKMPRISGKTHSWLCERALDESGYLIGSKEDILGALHKLEGDWPADQQDVERHLPPGIEIIGVYGPDADAIQAVAKLLPVEYACTPRTDGQFTLLDRKGTVHEVIVVDGILSDYLVLRYSETRTMRSTDDEPAWEEAYWSAIPDQLKPISGDEDGRMTIGEALTPGTDTVGGDEDVREAKPTKGSQKKKKDGGGKGRHGSFSRPSNDSARPTPSSYRDYFRDSSVGPWAELSLFERRSFEDGEDDRVGLHLTFHAAKAPLPPPRRLCSELLVYTRPEAPLREFNSHLVDGLRQLWAHAEAEEQDRPMELFTYHVAPPQCGCVFPLRLTVPLVLEELSTSLVRVAGQENEDERLRTLRQRLHERTGVPLNRPLFRTTAALRLDAFDDAQGEGEGTRTHTARLSDVHVGVGPSGVQDGRQFLVDGTYLYYHYMQDGLDDRGWGCAYRSLQTIASFFLLNHYTTKPVPTHRQIQQALVDMGDQPPDLVGSRQWIGSMELGYYLDQELGVSWRNIYTSSGPELAEKARDLARHFETHGTPVMMGGGQLAFTILGVDWNERTGQVKFLILDPHYTGAEDLRTIQGKSLAMQGYRATPCGWRSADTFARHSFYNLCLPSRPSIF